MGKDIDTMVCNISNDIYNKCDKYQVYHILKSSEEFLLMSTQKSPDLEQYQLALISLMHFTNDVSQQEIAAKLNLSKMTVSRMLQRAKKQKIIQIKIKMPFQIEDKISRTIESTYGIKKAFVINNDNTKSESTSELIGKVWSFYTVLSLKDDYILGLGLGNTIGSLVRNLVPVNLKNIHIVQLMGGFTAVTYKNPLTIVQEVCRKLNAKGTYVTSPVLVDNKDIRESIINETTDGIQVKTMWENCNEALFGIGTIEKGTILSPELVSVEDLELLKKKGAVGDILGHCFDEEGNFLKTYLENKLVSIPIEIFRKIPERVAVAGGVHKSVAIRGALRSGIITTLITDKATAKKVLG
jgi:DNA-binding transcriptional regulator LsrR (DeoR family)